MPFSVSVVIRCYNESQHIEKLIQGILQQTLQNIEIVIVDSGSTDGTVEIVSAYPVKLITIQPEQFSFGRSLNLGCQAVTSELIVIASAHVYPIYQDWLEKLLEPFEDSNVALTYGRQRGNEITKYSENQIFSTWFPSSCSSPGYQNHPFCNNANAAIRHSLWQKFPYDELLTGLEDLDWAKRVMAAGHKIAYIPEAEVIHVHNETPIRIYNRYRREAIAMKQIYPQERFTFWDFTKLLSCNILSDCSHAIKDKVLWRKILEILAFRWMQFLGTYHGYIQKIPVSSQLRQTFYYPPKHGKNPSSEASASRQLVDYLSQS